MKVEKSVSIVAGVMSFGLAAGASSAFAGMNPEWSKPGDALEKCAGIVKKGQNDCGANGHSCSGKGAIDNDPNEWIFMPKGLCEKTAGGKVVGSKTLPAPKGK
jgi:uncharacterized membrane protein